jgi:hypothetical protein
MVATYGRHEAIGRALPPSIKMIVSGHIHMFEALSFGDDNPRVHRSWSLVQEGRVGEKARKAGGD